MTAQPEPVEPLAPEVQALALAALAKQIKRLDPVVRATFTGDYENGDGRTFRAPDGRKLGKVRRNDPDPSWEITDRGKLVEHLRQQGYEETVRELAVPPDHPELLAVLTEHAPHLLAEHRRVPDDVLTDHLAWSRDNGEALAPGITFVQPEGSLVVTVDPTTGVDAAAALVRAGRLDWSLRPELDAGRAS